ncbi:MAG TPA: rhodanese-like domain-containing protein [Pilimelia sp.]|nr:rhodanese-like domain-containing protein [Pilimelia sp.]
MPAEIPTVAASDIGPDAYLLDVREDEEWRAGHPPGAHHLPMSELPGRLADVPRDRTVVVVCRVGARSGQVVAYLRQHGWHNVHNLGGGLHRWVADGQPLVSEDGQPARVR